jgi:ribose transport system substrate-binding protein
VRRTNEETTTPRSPPRRRADTPNELPDPPGNLAGRPVRGPAPWQQTKGTIVERALARRPGVVTALIAALTVLTACGGGNSPTTGAIATLSADALTRANQHLAPYTGHPSPFPVDEPLVAKPGAGSTIGYLQCSTPICALIGDLAKEATTALGVPLIVVKAGASAQSLQEAMSSLIAQNPAAVLLPAADPVQYREPMQQLQALGVPVVSSGVVNADQFPAIKGQILGASGSRLAGTLLADWTVKRNGAKPVVFYNIPELSFSPFVLDGFQNEMATLCPACQLRVVELPIATIGNRAPATVVSDLQSHPDTATAVFGSEEAANGLPAAMKVANIKIDTVGLTPDPAVLGYIKNGDITAGLGFDLRTTVWTQVDMAARLLTGQPLSGAEKTDPSVMRMLEQKDVTFDPSHGFNGYPDVADRYARLWPAKAAG